MPNGAASWSSCSRTRAISCGALVAHHMGQRRLAEHAAQRRVEQSRQPRVGALDRADRLIELQRSLMR